MELLELCSAEMLKKVIYKTFEYQRDRRKARSSQDGCIAACEDIDNDVLFGLFERESLEESSRLHKGKKINGMEEACQYTHKRTVEEATGPPSL